MKKIIGSVGNSLSGSVLAAFLLATLVLTLPLLPTGCVSTPVVTDGVTNIVTTIDPVKLDSAKALVNATASDVFRRALAKSPEHAKEISGYVRGVGTAFCQVKSSGRFSPDDVFRAVDGATAGLQTGVSNDVITAKNLLLGLYRILWNDRLTVTVPGNKWPAAIVDVICDSIDQALRDSNQPGVK